MVKLSAPIQLLKQSVPAEAGPVRLLQEAGFAIKLCAPAGNERWVPPGQGQLILALRGDLRLQQRRERAGAEQHGAERDEPLQQSQLAQVPNDAHWSLSSSDKSQRALIISTSVPRMVQRPMDLTRLSSGRLLAGSKTLFANQSLTLGLRGLNGRLPFRRRWQLEAQQAKNPILLVVQGLLEGGLYGPQGESLWQGELPVGSLLRLPAGSSARFQAHERCLLLTVESKSGTRSRTAQGPFSPFIDG